MPFDVQLQPLQSVETRRVFTLPREATAPVLIAEHLNAFPACLVLGDSESLFHKRTAVRLD